jgi:hypothetical protein
MRLLPAQGLIYFKLTYYTNKYAVTRFRSLTSFSSFWLYIIRTEVRPNIIHVWWVKPRLAASYFCNKLSSPYFPHYHWIAIIKLSYGRGALTILVDVFLGFPQVNTGIIKVNLILTIEWSASFNILSKLITHYSIARNVVEWTTNKDQIKHASLHFGCLNVVWCFEHSCSDAVLCCPSCLQNGSSDLQCQWLDYTVYRLRGAERPSREAAQEIISIYLLVYTLQLLCYLPEPHEFTPHSFHPVSLTFWHRNFFIFLAHLYIKCE